jgi:hypothetical protein
MATQKTVLSVVVSSGPACTALVVRCETCGRSASYEESDLIPASFVGRIMDHARRHAAWASPAQLALDG